MREHERAAAVGRRVFLRMIASGAALAGAGALLGACGAPSPSADATAAPEAAPLPPATISAAQTITFSYYDNGYIAATVEAFQAANPDIQVSLAGGGGGDVEAALLRLLDHPDVPDVCVIGSPWVGTFAQQGGLADLAAAPYDAINLRDNITPASWSEGLTSEGRLIGMPLSTSPGSLWYRKDLFDAAKIPSDPGALRERVKTWDDLFSLAQELKRATPNVSLFVEPLQDVFSPMVAQQGNNLIDGNKVLIVEKCTQPAFKAAEARKLKLDADLGGSLFDGVGTEAMLAGKLAGVAAATIFQKFISDRFFNTIGQWRVIPPPGGPYSRFTEFLVIPEKSQKKELAWTFIKYCCATAEGQNTLLKTAGGFPVFMPAWKDPLYDQPVALFGDQAVYRLWAEVSAGAPPGKASPHDRDIDDKLFPKIRDVVEQGLPPEQAMKDAEAAVIAAFPGLTA